MSEKLIQQQGDVLVFAVAALPAGLKPVKPRPGLGYVIAEGEHTGNTHRIETVDSARVFVAPDGTLYAEILAPVPLIHGPTEPHKPQTIKPGFVRFGRVREVDPFAGEVRQVKD